MTRDADSTFTLINTKLLSTTTTNGNDEGNYNAGALVLQNSTLTYSAALVNTGSIQLDLTSLLTAPAFTGNGKFIIDVTGIGLEPVTIVKGNFSGFNGTIELINEDNATYKITEEGIVVYRKLLGEGTEANPYLINDLMDLQFFRNSVNAGEEKYNAKGVYVALNADIDLNSSSVVTFGLSRLSNLWTPIGTDSTPFKGIFDGQGHTISNLNVSVETRAGLFGEIAGATIKNVNIHNVSLEAVSYLGSIVGMGYTGRIENCHVSGNVAIEGNYMVGGISGHGYATIVDCSVIANDKTTDFIRATHDGGKNEGDNVGGIVGHSAENVDITNCTVKNVTISGTRKVAGITGITSMSSEVTGCTVENVIVETNATVEYANDNLKTMSIGGIVGQYQASGSNGSVAGSTVSGLEFRNLNNVTVSAGSLIGGMRGTTVVLPPSAEIATDGAMVSNVTGDTNSFFVVAEVNGVRYTSLQDAINMVNAGEVITLLDDIVVINPAYGQNAININRAVSFTIDLNNHTLSADAGNSVVRFNITDSGATSNVTVTIKNGTVISGDNTWCALMAAGISSDVKAIFNLEDLEVYNSKPGDLGIKAWANSVINAKNVNVHSTNGAGGFYALGGEIVLDNCTVVQEGLYTAPYLSMAVAVSNGGKLTVNSGTYSATPTSASEGYNQGSSHGSWVAGVMSSGGTLVINGGTFTNGNFGEDELATAARGLLFVDCYGKLEINGGTFNALKGVVDYQNNLGVAAGNPVVTINGGTYTSVLVDSFDSVKLFSSYVNLNGRLYIQYNADEYTIELEEATNAVAKIGMEGFLTLQDAFAAAGDNDTITLLSDITLDTKSYTIPDGVSVTLDMNGKTIDVVDNRTAGNYELFYIYGELTVTGNGTINLSSTTNREWNAMSTIFHNRGGVLTIENGTYTNNGITAMAYVIDNSANYYGDAVTNILDGTLYSSYIAIRNRMEENSHGASGIAILNVSGGSIDALKRAIWAQASSTSLTSPATGIINITGGEVGFIQTAYSAGSTALTTISGGIVDKFEGKVNELKVNGGTVNDVTILTTSGEVVPYS